MLPRDLCLKILQSINRIKGWVSLLPLGLSLGVLLFFRLRQKRSLPQTGATINAQKVVTTSSHAVFFISVVKSCSCKFLLITEVQLHFSLKGYSAHQITILYQVPWTAYKGRKGSSVILEATSEVRTSAIYKLDNGKADVPKRRSYWKNWTDPNFRQV